MSYNYPSSHVFCYLASDVKFWVQMKWAGFMYIFFKKMGQPRPLFVYFRSFQQKFNRKIEDFSGNRTLIVRVEGKQADQ